MTSISKHRPVLAQEVSDFIQPRAGEVVLDATFGGGGYSRLILETYPDCQVVAVDRDEAVVETAKALAQDFPERFSFTVMSYDEMSELGQKFDGIMFDLGLSSDQLDDPERGFSFQPGSILDARFDTSRGQTAAQWLNQTGKTELENTFRDLAEDRYWRGLAARVIEARAKQPFRTAEDLIKVIGSERPSVLAPIFQSIRIVVNDELNILKRGLASAESLLNPGGRLAVVSFHSLEDRIVKQFLSSSELEVVTKKPLVASEVEVNLNPRSRSAKLRLARQGNK